MQALLPHVFRGLSIGIIAASAVALAQDAPPPPPPDAAAAAPATSNNGWKRVGDSAQTYQAPAPPNQNQSAPPNYGQQPYPQQPAYQPPPPIPASLTIPRGTFLVVRVNQMLSSDKNQTGDAFSASLAQPVVVSGVVIAEPGQTLGGRVAEAQKAGHIEGTSRLAVQLTELTLVDGQQLPLQASLVSRKGPTSVGQDAGAIAGTTGLGAAIGAAAGWGKGAAIGAGAGAAAGIIGVLVTRGHPSVIYPEQLLTFRIETPLTISTERSPQAFRYVQPNEYDRPYETQPAPGPYASEAPAPPPPYYGAYPPYPYPYYGYGYPYYWGPSFSFFVGPRFGWGGYYGRGYYGGGYFRRGPGGFHGSFHGGHR
ncbi:MAG TPA: hypothetical protein VGK64_01790 [Bryobacteraceae bacterium]